MSEILQLVVKSMLTLCWYPLATVQWTCISLTCLKLACLLCNACYSIFSVHTNMHVTWHDLCFYQDSILFVPKLHICSRDWHTERDFHTVAAIKRQLETRNNYTLFPGPPLRTSFLLTNFVKCNHPSYHISPGTLRNQNPEVAAPDPRVVAPDPGVVTPDPGVVALDPGVKLWSPPPASCQDWLNTVYIVWIFTACAKSLMSMLLFVIVLL